MICSSLNLDRFIVRLLAPTDSTQIWRKFRGSGQFRQVIAEKGYGRHHNIEPKRFFV